MLLIQPQLSPITAIKLCNCFKVTVGLMVKSLSGCFPLRQLCLEGHLYHCSDWVMLNHEGTSSPSGGWKRLAWTLKSSKGSTAAPLRAS